MLKDIIKKSYIIQKPIRYIYSSIPDYIRYGSTFRETYNFLKQSEKWDEKKLKEYQLKELQKLIYHSYETVPYYNKLFNEVRIKPKDIQDFNDIKKIPYLTKEIIRNNLEDLISNKYDKNKLKYVTTGGSTGVPMGFYVDKLYDKPREWAFITSMWSRIGYDVNKVNRNVILRGNIPYKGVYEYKNRDLILSSFKLTEENMHVYIDLMEKFNPDFIRAYPSAIHMLCKYILNNNIKPKMKNLKAIICASENLYNFQRKEIEEAFGVRVYSFYGHSEHACIGGECENTGLYHLQSEYGYSEIINETGQDAVEEDEIGELVATGFGNYAMPFIRYRTNDMVVNTNKICNCGRHYKVIKKVEGRQQEYFLDKNGEKVIFTWADYPLWEYKDMIWAYQYIQNEPGQVILNIELKKGVEINSKDFKNIKKIFLDYYTDFDIEILLVKSIQRTKRGKFKYLVQNLNI